MSEHNPRPESHEPQPKNVEHEQHQEHLTVVKDTMDKSSESAAESIEAISKKAEQHAKSTAEHAPTPHKSESQHHPVIVNKHLKDTAYNRTMIRVQKRLSLPQKYLSKAIHSPLLDKPSEVASKTIARPSGMLGGALFSMVGTLVLFWVVNKHGYEYNYLAVVALFLAGAIFGLLIEGFIKFLKR